MGKPYVVVNADPSLEEYHTEAVKTRKARRLALIRDYTRRRRQQIREAEDYLISIGKMPPRPGKGTWSQHNPRAGRSCLCKACKEARAAAKAAHKGRAGVWKNHNPRPFDGYCGCPPCYANRVRRREALHHMNVLSWVNRTGQRPPWEAERTQTIAEYRQRIESLLGRPIPAWKPGQKIPPARLNIPVGPAPDTLVPDLHFHSITDSSTSTTSIDSPSSLML